MRRCAVNYCTNSDITVLSHRFPKNRHFAQLWQQKLKLGHIPIETLIAKYTICYMHFNITDYRNSLSNSLNLNAVPQIQPNNPRKMAVKETKDIPPEIYSPTHWRQMQGDQTPTVNVSDSIELLHEDADDATEIDDNIGGSPLDTDDICILPEEQNAADDLIQSIEGAGFTMLNATSCEAFEITEHSTDLKLGSESDSGHSHEFPVDSTDSDVEVLVSESIFESQWSETDNSAIVLRGGQTDTTDSAVSQCVSPKTGISTKNRVLDTEYENLDKKQLIEVIRQQSTIIEELKQKLESFKSAQKILIGHFKAFKETVCDGDSD